MYTVYILKTSGNTFYTGITNNLKRRLQEHRLKGARSSKYMRSFDNFELVYKEFVKSRSNALRREAQIKQLTRKEKDCLIKII